MTVRLIGSWALILTLIPCQGCGGGQQGRELANQRPVAGEPSVADERPAPPEAGNPDSTTIVGHTGEPVLTDAEPGILPMLTLAEYQELIGKLEGFEALVPIWAARRTNSPWIATADISRCHRGPKNCPLGPVWALARRLPTFRSWI